MDRERARSCAAIRMSVCVYGCVAERGEVCRNLCVCVCVYVRACVRGAGRDSATYDVRVRS